MCSLETYKRLSSSNDKGKANQLLFFRAGKLRKDIWNQKYIPIHEICREDINYKQILWSALLRICTYADIHMHTHFYFHFIQPFGSYQTSDEIHIIIIFRNIHFVILFSNLQDDILGIWVGFFAGLTVWRISQWNHILFIQVNGIYF